MVSTTMDMLKLQLPLQQESLILSADMKTSLVVVDLVNGFCTIDVGNLTSQPPDKQMSETLDESVRLARAFCDRNWSVLACLNSHHPDVSEPSYPSHCIIGTHKAELAPVHGVEHTFGAHEYPTTEIFEGEPKQCDGFTSWNTILIGKPDMGLAKVRTMMEELAENYKGNAYNLMTTNCAVIFVLNSL